MDQKHFALTQVPFDLQFQPEDRFASNTLSEAETRLKHLLELRAIGLVTGEAGSGKATVCRKVAASLHPGLYRVFSVPLSTGNVMDKSIGWELPLLEPPAIEAVFQATQGMPRKVNRLAHYALTGAVIEKAGTVTADHVPAAREEVAP